MPRPLLRSSRSCRPPAASPPPASSRRCVRSCMVRSRFFLPMRFMVLTLVTLTLNSVLHRVLDLDLVGRAVAPGTGTGSPSRRAGCPSRSAAILRMMVRGCFMTRPPSPAASALSSSSMAALADHDCGVAQHLVGVHVRRRRPPRRPATLRAARRQVRGRPRPARPAARGRSTFSLSEHAATSAWSSARRASSSSTTVTLARRHLLAERAAEASRAAFLVSFLRIVAGLAGRRPRRRRARSATAGSRRGRGRCPSAATASCRGPATSPLRLGGGRAGALVGAVGHHRVVHGLRRPCRRPAGRRHRSHLAERPCPAYRTPSACS